MTASGIHARAIALVLGAVGLCVAAPAAALTININSIAGEPSSGFTPNARLGLTSAPATDTALKHIINIDDCKAYSVHASPKVRIKWSWTDKPLLSKSTPQYGIKVAGAGKSCDANTMTEPAANSVDCKVLVTDKSFTADEFIDIDLKLLLGATKCDVASEQTAKVYFIISGEHTDGAAKTTAGVVMNVLLDYLAPKPPAIQSLTSGNANLKVTWKHVDELTAAKTLSRVHWSTTPITPTTAWTTNTQSEKMTGTSYQIAGVANATNYYVSVVALDESDNASDGSEPQQAAPLEVQDFWQYYQAHGGAEEGGYAACSASPAASNANSLGGLALLAAAAGFVLATARRRSAHARTRAAATARKLLAIGASALLFAAADPALAASPQTSSLELRVGVYEPGIDREFKKSGVTPYADILKDSAFEYGFSIDWRVLHGFGELAFGVGLSTWEKEGVSKAVSGTATQDTTTLDLVPVTVDAVYRFDVLAKKFDFPLVPYVKAGLAYTFWWVENGLGDTSSYTGVDSGGKTVTAQAQGGTGGLHGTVGLRILLDVFEPQAARGFDIEMGVNHSYIFAEYRRLSLNDFGNPKSIDLSDDVLTFGLAFDM